MPDDRKQELGGKKVGLIRSTSLKLKNLFKPSIRSTKASSAPTTPTLDSTPEQLQVVMVEEESSTNQRQSMSVLNSASDSSCGLTIALSLSGESSYASCSSYANNTSSSSNKIKQKPRSRTTSSQNSSHEGENKMLEEERLWIRASTFEWAWNWDSNWTSSCSVAEHAAEEVAPAFPRTLDLIFGGVGAKEVERVSPMMSTVDLGLDQFTGWPNSRIEGVGEDGIVGIPLSSYFSDDDSDDEDEEEVEKQEEDKLFKLVPSFFDERRRSHTLPTQIQSHPLEQEPLPIFTISTPQETQTGKVTLKRAHTNTIRRKPPPAFIEPILPSVMFDSVSCGDHMQGAKDVLRRGRDSARNSSSNSCLFPHES